jgi:SAM-dependent methyltransferase
MNEHDKYMADFLKIFETLERWGPGSMEDTLAALSKLPVPPKQVLEIGCGKGLTTRILCHHSQASITAMDNEPLALEALKLSVNGTELENRVKTICASMTDLPFEDGSFDLIWAEGSAYIMGVANALRDWRRILTEQGVLVLSDLVWLNNEPSAEAKEFWDNEYPDISSISTRLQQMNKAGYTVLNYFALSQQSWDNYTGPLEHRIEELKEELKGDELAPMTDSLALADIVRELTMYKNYVGEDFGYVFFILQKN